MTPLWPIEKLGSLCEFDPSKSQLRDSLVEDLHVSFLPMNELGIGQRVSSRETKPLSSVYKGYTYFADGDVLLAKITPCFENGKLGIAEGLENAIGFGSSEFMVLRPGPRVSAAYLAYFLGRDEFRIAGQAAMTGAVGHKRVPKEWVESCTIPVPPLAEQERIVALLDEVFAGIALATENAKKSIAEARELRFSCGELLLVRHGPDAEQMTLEEALERGWITGHLDGNHGSFYPRAEEFVESGVPYIAANCIVGDQIDLRRAKYLMPERAALIRKGVAQNGDVIFAHNATVGPVAILRTEEPKVILSTSVTYYRCSPSWVSAEYLKHFMRSRRFVSQYEAVMRQSTRNQVPITMQRRFKFTFPPADRQDAIASTLEAVEVATAEIANLASRKLAALAELKQSLLACAFSGELIHESLAA